MNDDLNWRYATKKFDPSKKISKQDFTELLEALRFSPVFLWLTAMEICYSP